MELNKDIIGGLATIRISFFNVKRKIINAYISTVNEHEIYMYELLGVSKIISGYLVLEVEDINGNSCCPIKGTIL